LPALIGDLGKSVGSKNGLNQRMFDAMHEELRVTKTPSCSNRPQADIRDDFVYDDLETIHRQCRGRWNMLLSFGGLAANLFEHLKVMDMNIMHNCEFIVEVLAASR